MMDVVEVSFRVRGTESGSGGGPLNVTSHQYDPQRRTSELIKAVKVNMSALLFPNSSDLLFGPF